MFMCHAPLNTIYSVDATQILNQSQYNCNPIAQFTFTTRITCGASIVWKTGQLQYVTKYF